jgi:CRISPR-associated protein Cmr2
MSKYLLLFTISPVQSFIEQSRKTQDLYAASFLLSHLCRESGNLLKTKCNGEIVFPNFKNDSCPNRFLAIVESDENTLKEIGESLKEIVERTFKRMADQILKDFKLDKPNWLDEQIQDFFNVNWLFVPFDENEYQKCYKDIESNMGAIKNVRSFNQHHSSEKGRKCAICGERNVKFYRKTKKEIVQNEDVKEKKIFSNNVCIVDKIELRYLQEGEGLCGVCFVKRCLDKADLKNYSADFPSTSHIALFDALEKLKNTDSYKTTLKELVDSNKNNYEPQTIFALKNNEKPLEKDNFENSKKIYDALKQNKIGFSPYYAVMLFDGDSMGEWLSGSKIKDEELLGFHKALTEQLGIFAGNVKNKIKKPAGVTVYAGGEDFLGFFNLNYLLENAKMLYDDFKTDVDNHLKNFKKNEDENITFSAGIVIAHIKTPLSEVLGWARKMEKEAKAIDSDKNAFGIAVLKRSGEVVKSVCKWNIDKLFVPDALKEIITQIKDEKISKTFIGRFDEEFRHLDSEDKRMPLKIKITELKRLLKRSVIKAENEDKESFQKRKNEILETLNLESLLNNQSLCDFLNLLHICTFIARNINGEEQ